MNYYISDTHFGHANIIRFDDRPFDNVTQMDDGMIKLWNETVNNNDTVYILGDFSWHNESQTIKILDSLKGKKILIKGNHDKISPLTAKKFIKICDYLEIKDGNEKIILSHYPILFWNNQFNDTVHLYGHVHTTQQYSLLLNYQKEVQRIQKIPMRMYNIGCMLKYMNYTPSTLMNILENGNRL